MSWKPGVPGAGVIPIGVMGVPVPYIPYIPMPGVVGLWKVPGVVGL